MMKNTKLLPLLPLLMLALALLAPTRAWATHNRAGEITYEQISPLTYRVTVTTITRVCAECADRDELEVFFGDGTWEVVLRANWVMLEPEKRKNTYTTTHTYPGPGTYVIRMEDPNRNENVVNIPNSVNVMFALRTTLQINPALGSNSTPLLLNDPIDKAAVGRLFIHNPGAWDPDGDSISYKLAVCLGQDGEPIANYTFPLATNVLYVDSITGDLVWDSPPYVGTFNVAMAIEEWRGGVKIGQIIRDMQIEVKEAESPPPVIGPVPDLCVTAGDTVRFVVQASNPTGQFLRLAASGGVFRLPILPASFPIVSGRGQLSGNFFWATDCAHVQKEPYTVTFRAEGMPDTLSTYATARIRVVAPAPENLDARAESQAVSLRWETSPCQEAIGYNVYRKKSFFGFEADSCETGVPAYTGYTKIDFVEGVETLLYLDNERGLGLQPGFTYCYMVVALFADGAESYASNEACAELIRGMPLITKASVLRTDTQEGQVEVEWSAPRNIDLQLFPGPYRYSVFSAAVPAERLELLFQPPWTDPYYVEGLYDTTLTLEGLNTRDFAYAFRVGLYNFNPLTQKYDQLMGVPEDATTVFINFYASDNQVEVVFNKVVPWENERYDVYRLDEGTGEFNLVGQTDSTVFLDSGLVNWEEYCYKVMSEGGYSVADVVDPIRNWSQEACATPIDTIPPCQPRLHLATQCDSLYNRLAWTNPNNYCSNDAVGYRVYYTHLLDGDFGPPIHTTDSPDDTVFYHYPALTDYPAKTLAGCYSIAAVDSFDNETYIVQRNCVDQCLYYQIPNVFSPDGDGINDLLRPAPYAFVEKVDFRLFNRWGELVFQTQDPDLLWDGTHQASGQPVSPGVYYYLCDIYEHRISGLELRNTNGFIHVFDGAGPRP